MNNPFKWYAILMTIMVLGIVGGSYVSNIHKANIINQEAFQKIDSLQKEIELLKLDQKYDRDKLNELEKDLEYFTDRR